MTDRLGQREAAGRLLIADYREQCLANERKKLDEDFGYSEPGTGTDRLIEKNRK